MWENNNNNEAHVLFIDMKSEVLGQQFILFPQISAFKNKNKKESVPRGLTTVYIHCAKGMNDGIRGWIQDLTSPSGGSHHLLWRSQILHPTH